MKIALIRPYYDMALSDKPKMIKFRAESYPPLGLCYIASYLMKYGIKEPEVIDCVERNYRSYQCAQYVLENKIRLFFLLIKSITAKIFDFR